MYIKDNKAYPKGIVELEAQENNMSLEDYVSQNDFSLLEESEGKPTDPPKKNQSGDQEEVKTDGESSSVNGSLESSERDNELAREILQARAAITKENSKVDIGVQLFNLEQTPDGSYRIKTSTSTLDAAESQMGTEAVAGFRQAGGVDSREFTGRGILSELGQENYDLYMSLSQGSNRITAEQLEQIDLDKVDENVINSVVAQRRQKEGELVARQFGQDKVEELESELPTEEEIQASFDQAEQEAKVLQVGKVYLDSELKNFEEKKKAIEEQGADLKALVERRKEIAESVTIIPKVSTESVDAYNEAYQLYLDAVNDYNSYVASEEVKALGEMAARLNQAAEIYNNRMEANAAAVNKTIEDAALSSVAVKSYNATDRIMFELEDSILGSATALMGLGADFINYLVDNEGVSEALDNFKGRTVQYAVDLENKRIKEMPLPVSDEDVESGKATYADQIVDITLNNSATILTVMVPTSAAGAGARIAGTIARKTATTAVKREIRKRAISTAARLSSGLFFVMEAGGEVRRVEGQQREFSKVDPVTGKTELESLTEKLEKGDFSGNQEKRNIESRIDLLANALNVTEIEKSFSAITKGAVAMYAERLGTLRTFQNAKKWTRATSAAKFSKYVSAPIAKWVANAEGLIRGIGRIAGTELVEEGLTLAAHNFIDITVQGENKSVLDGMNKEFAKNVVIPSLIIGGPGSLSNIGYAIRNEFLTSAQIKRQNAQIEKLFGIQERLESANMSEYDRQVLESKKMDLLREMSLEEANALIDASKLDAQDIEILAGLQADLSRLRSRAEGLGAEGASIEELNQINKEITDIVRKRDGILEKSDTDISERVKGAQDEAKAAMLLRSFERFNALGQISRGGKFVEIQTEEDFEKLPEELREKARAAEKEGKFGLNENGFSVVFNANAEYAIIEVGGDLALAAATVAVHEIGHTEIAGSGVLKDKVVAAVAKGFINTLKQNIESQVTKKRISQETANAILERFARYEQNTNMEDSVKAEELMMIISEMKALGLINKNSAEILSKGKVFLNALLNKVTPGNRMFIPLNNLADVNAFLDRFQSKLLEGGRIQTAPSEETKESKGLLDEINALVPDTVQTQADFFDRKVFNPIYNDGKLHPAIANYIRSKSVSKEEGNRIIESVADRLINFNPEATRKSGDAKITFGEFLFANVNFGKLDARKALFEEGQERAQTESTDSEQARQITAGETTTTVATEKPKYKSLVQRRVLSEETMSAVSAKVLSVVRVLKNAIDAKVGKNVTVTPLIAEIKKALGKQLDIDFKKEMGGLKDGELRKYLLKNKAAILENMTTTWLMTAMPNAVQKQVGGVWTSDWKGKKIDREKVTTDNAGRTSGAELVRRLPKASTRLSDADFLSNFFAEDGKLIRGRKESLAKAMGEEMGIEIIKDALNDSNSEIAQAFLNSQERAGVEDLNNIKVKFDTAAERGNVKFSEGISQIQAIGASIRTKFDMELPRNRGKMINKLLDRYGIDNITELNTTEEIDAWAENVKAYVLPLLPKEFWFTQKNGEYKESGSSAFRNSARFVGNRAVDQYFIDKINELRALDESAFGKPIEGLGEKVTASYDSNIGKNDASIQANIDNGKVKKFNDYHTAVHSAFWNRINDALKQNENNPEAVRAIARYLSLVSNMPAHPHKMGAEFVGYSMNAKGDGRKIYEWEHAMPATNAYVYLMDAILNGSDFNAAYAAVMSNYKLIALDKSEDLKMKAAGLNTSMPEGWDLLENDWWERYTAAGIDLSNIMTNSGISLAEAAGVNKYGERMTERAIGFSKLINQEELAKAKSAIQEVENQKTTKFSEGLSEEFNNILERKTGIESFKTFSDVQAEIRGRKKGKFKFFIAPAVDDFRGLVNFAFSGRGKQGEIDKQWLEDKLMTPYAKGISAIEGIRQQIKRDFKTAVKSFPKQYKLLNKTIGTSPFTYDHAVRVYLWQKAGFDTIPGLSKKDTKVLQDAIQAQPELIDFANSLLTVARRDEWIAPTEHWVAGTVLSDLNGMTEKIGRKKYLEEFIANAEVIFSKENLNKIEAAFGKNHREAIEDALYSMINGTNRSTGASQNKTVGKWLNWINGSTGAIMFFNRRSALLQMLSTVNFINYTDNNPVKAAAAFANQKQYWKDFAMIFNSDKLKERRGGLQQDVSSDEIASIANKNNRSPQALLARLLKLGFTPTQIADSMAIASGGATFYRNRVNTYLKQGMDQAAAEKQAFLDFSKISDETQQSSDPALVSQVQRSVLGRIVFAFQNTPMQMTRLMKKDALDLINGRGDWRVKVARIAYYGAIQNAIFSSLQSALFALIPGFDDEDDEDLTEEELIKRNTQEEGKIARALNSMLDTLLRGSGVYGAILAASKNVIREYNKQEKKGFLGDHSYTILSLFDISPPIGSKARKINTAIKTRTFEKDAIAERGWAVTAEGRLNLGPNWSILGNVVSATTNVPLDRVIAELTSVAEAFNAKNTAWQRVALGAGWKTWDVGVENEVNEKIKEAAEIRRKEEGVIKAKETRKANKKAKEEEIMKSLLKNIQTQDSIIEYNKGKK